MRKIVFFYITLLTMVCTTLHAKDDVTITAEGPEVVVSGDQFQLAYTINTQKVKDFRAPAMKGFDVLMGPSRRSFSNTQIINGKMSSESGITYTFILLAKEAGEFTIPGATAMADGKELRSNPLHVKVLPPDQEAQGSQGGAAGRQSNDASVSDNDLFVTATASKRSVYEQEAFLLTFKIYTRETQLGFENVKLPDFKGFHSQEIERPNNARWSQEHYKGRNYYTTVYRQFLLFPQQSGKLKIEPARFDATVAKAIRSIDPFDALFNGGASRVNVKKVLQTPAINIDVKALPAGKPEGFTGGVGQFEISSTINNTNIKTNDAITIKTVISGTGNLKLVSMPEVEFPGDFEIYDPKEDNSKIRVSNNGLTGNKVIEYLAIPRHAGDFKIPSVAFSYFDTKTKAYKTLHTDEFEIHVAKGEGKSEQVVANFTSKEELKVLGEDIRYLHLGKSTVSKRGEIFFGSMGYWLCYLIPLLLMAVLFVVYRKQVAENANVAKMKTKKANKVAVKRMKQAQKLLAANQKDAFYDEVLKAMWGYMSDKLNIPVSQLSKENILEKLNAHKVDEALTKEFIDALNECEFARFAPGDENQAMDKVYASSVRVISKMEDSIK